MSIGINFTPSDSLSIPNAANTVEILTPDVLKQGDTFNEIRVRLKRNKVNVDFANVTVTWSAAGAKGTVITDRPATIHENGELSLSFTEEDKGAWGTLRIEFKVTHNGTNKIEKFPANDHVRLHVTRSHDDLSHTPVMFASISYFNSQVEAAAKSALEASKRALLVEGQGQLAQVAAVEARYQAHSAENAAAEASVMAYNAENAAQEASAAKALTEEATLEAKVETDYIVGKRPLIEQSIADAGTAIVVAGAAKTTAEAVRGEFNQVVAEAGSNNPEVVNARGSFGTLKQRLDDTTTALAETATKEEVSNALDGSPKGTYATLADLQTAYPSGTTGVYIVTADGHIYSWDGAVWADRGLYQSQGIANGSVTKNSFALDVKSEIEVPIKNGINNPDFTGTTGWTGGGGTISATGNVLTVNANSTSFDPRAQQLATYVPYGNGHKIYVKGKFKPTTSNVKAFKIYATATGMTNVFNTIANPVLNEWNDVSTIITLGSGGSGNLGLWFTFNQIALATEKVGELIEVLAFNLTDAFGVGNEPTIDKMDKILSYYPTNWFKAQASLSKTVQYAMDKVDKSELLPIQAKLKDTPRKVGSNSVVLTFDGSWANVISSGAIDEVEKIGGKATFFPNTTVLNKANYLTSAQLLDLYNRGHEIGVYGSDASSNMLTGMTLAAAEAMVKARQADVKAIIGKNPRSMAYPQGSANLNTHKISTRYFDRVRLTNLRWMMPKNAFIAFSHPSVVDSNVNDVISAIERAAKDDKDLVLIFHTIQSSGATTIENFKKTLQAIVNNNMRCESLERVMSRYNLIDDPWYDFPLTTTFDNVGWVKNSNSVTIEEGSSNWGDRALTISGTGRADSRAMLDPTYPNYILNVPYKLVGRTSGSLIISIRYADAMDTYISSQTIVVSADTDWTIGRIEMTLPMGAVSAVIRLESSSNAGAKCDFGRVVLHPTYAGDFTANPA